MARIAPVTRDDLATRQPPNRGAHPIAYRASGSPVMENLAQYDFGSSPITQRRGRFPRRPSRVSCGSAQPASDSHNAAVRGHHASVVPASSTSGLFQLPANHLPRCPRSSRGPAAARSARPSRPMPDCHALQPAPRESHCTAFTPRRCRTLITVVSSFSSRGPRSRRCMCDKMILEFSFAAALALTIALAVAVQSTLAIAAASPPRQGGGLLPPDRNASTNWSSAGLLSVGGIPARRTVCTTVSPLGSGRDNSTSIQNAVSACPLGQVVSLAAGTFTIAEGHYVLLDKGITLRERGRGSRFCKGLTGPSLVATYRARTHHR